MGSRHPGSREQTLILGLTDSEAAGRSRRFRPILFTLLVYLAFFASGAASLTAEVTWNRMLIVVVGNSITAAALIIAVFMGGLGLGSYFGGRAFGARPPSLVPYVLLEAAIGAFVALSPTLFGLLSELFTSMAPIVANRTALSLVRLLVTMAALLIPAFLMGATFPAMINGASFGKREGGGARIGYLYSVNTMGAAIGCFAAGYHVLLEFGVQTALFSALGLYLLAASCALVASALRSSDAADRPIPAVAEAQPPADARRLRRLLYGATFCIGFVSLAYEVLLTRLSILYLGNSVSVFPLVLTAFLLGTGTSAILGTWLYGRLQHGGAWADAEEARRLLQEVE